MRLFHLTILLLVAKLVVAQDSNIFYDQSFWKTNPDIKTIKQKIAEGNDPVALTPSGFDGTVYAILADAPLETVQFMLAQGNDVNKATHDGRNYLMWAAYRGNVELMKYLLSQNSKTDIVDDHGYNLMTFAAVAGQQNPEVYDLILANGGNVTNTNRDGANALLLLLPHLKDDKILNYFKEQGLDLNTKDNEGNGAFNYAALRGNRDMMKKLIDMGLDYKELNDNGGNAMIFASYGSRGYTNGLEVYQYLESLGIEPNIVTKDGVTPLHNIAYSAKDFAIFEYFMGKEVDINQVDKDGNTAFLNAVDGGNFDIAKKIAPKVKDFDHTNKDGYSALTYAIMNNSADMVDFLLSKGGNIKVIDKKGNNLVYHAFISFNPAKAEAFEKFIDLLKIKGVSLNERLADGSTLLHLAVENEESYLVEKALGLGVDINQKNEEGLTPLHIAAMKAKDKELLSLLIEKGADKTILTDFDESAFDLASENELLNQTDTNLEFLKIN